MKRTAFILLLTLLLSMTAFAHSGRTDKHGGHRDKNNFSGLGSYHYHCGGHPAHLHTDNICPYAPKPEPEITSSEPATTFSKSSPYTDSAFYKLMDFLDALCKEKNLNCIFHTI